MRRTKSVARAQTEESLGEEIAHLRDLDLKGLRSRWQKRDRKGGGPAPAPTPSVCHDCLPYPGRCHGRSRR